jgi:methylenetetrahydrofolate dehydrogenase (NADP+)/methenyltetrahydrofolate cyclohydrolase
MELLDGKSLASTLAAELATRVAALPGPRRPKVAFVRVGEDPASVSYVRKKERTAAEVGIESELHVFPDDIAKDDLFAEVDRLNADPSVDGILIQSPLPGHIADEEAFDRVDPSKDVDGFHKVNLGKLVQEDPTGFVACTPRGILTLLDRYDIAIPGKRVVVVGRSLIVGKPLALLFLRRQKLGNATVTVCHSRTPDLGEVTRQADILVAAVGQPRMIDASMVRPGAVVVDVGINRVPDASRKSGHALVGDVDFASVQPVSGPITPVPGGVGPLTVAMLMENTLQAYQLHEGATPA